MPWTLSSAPVGLVSCSMKPLDMGWRVILTAKGSRHSAVALDSRWPRSCARWSMTGQCQARRRSMWTTRGRPRRTVLVENGILRGYLQDRLKVPPLMGVAPSGNGRRESYAHMPMPRMTNTFMLGGESTPQDIIASVASGLYAVSFGGGQVDITNGKFVFSASEAYFIEDGKLTASSQRRQPRWQWS